MDRFTITLQSCALLFLGLIISSCWTRNASITDRQQRRIIYISSGQDIQRALDKLKSNQEIILRSGLHELGKTLVVEGKSNFIIKGEQNALIKVRNGVSKTPDGGIFRFKDCDNFTVENLILDANIENRILEDNQVPAHSIRLLGVSFFTIRNIVFKNSIQDAITIQQTDIFPEHGIVENCSIKDFWRSGISIINGRNITINKLEIDAGYYGYTGGGINVEENDWNKIPNEGISIENCNFNKLSYGVQLSSKGLGSKNVTIRNCYFSMCKIGVYNSYNKTVIDSCKFVNSISEVNHHNVIRSMVHSNDQVSLTIKNSKFKNSQLYATIYAQKNVDKLSVIDNEFLNCKGYSISSYAKKLIVKSNNFTGGEKTKLSAFYGSCFVEDNTFADVDTRIVYFKKVKNGSIVNNRITYSKSRNSNFLPDMIKGDNCEKVEIKKNTVKIGQNKGKLIPYTLNEEEKIINE